MCSTKTVSHHPFLLPQPHTIPPLSTSDYLLNHIPSWKSNLLLHLYCLTPSHILWTTLNNTSHLSYHSILAICDSSLNVT